MKKIVFVLIILISGLLLFGCTEDPNNLLDNNQNQPNINNANQPTDNNISNQLLSLFPKEKENLHYIQGNADEVDSAKNYEFKFKGEKNCEFKDSEIKFYKHTGEDINLNVFIGKTESKTIAKNCLNNLLTNNFDITRTNMGNEVNYYKNTIILDNNVLNFIWKEHTGKEYVNSSSYTSDKTVIYVSTRSAKGMLINQAENLPELFEQLFKSLPSN